MALATHRIFISHSHLDNDFGTKLAQDLRRVLADEDAVFYDVLGGLHGGERWWDKIVEELTARDVFLLILSPDSMNSLWVRREIDVALNENKYIIPIFHRTCSIRADLKILQIISFLAPKSYEVAFQEVLDALGLPKETPVAQQDSVRQSPEATDLATVLIQQMGTAFADHDWPDVIRKATYLIRQTAGNVSSTVYRLQGLALLEEGEVQQAQEALETALALVSDQQQRLTLLGDYAALLAREEQWTKVLQQTKEALHFVPNDPGWLATQQQAQSKLPQQTLVSPPSPPSHKQKQRSTKKQRATATIEKTKEQWRDKGNTLYSLQRYEEALEADEQAIRLDPKDAISYNNKGLTLYSLQRYEEAIEAYDQVIRLDPNLAEAYNNKGLALNNLQHYEEAVEAYDQAISLDPNFAVGYNNKGLALDGLQRYEEAVEAYDQAISLDPNLAVAYYSKGAAMKQLGKRRESQQAYERAKQLGYNG